MWTQRFRHRLRYLPLIFFKVWRLFRRLFSIYSNSKETNSHETPQHSLHIKGIFGFIQISSNWARHEKEWKGIDWSTGVISEYLIPSIEKERAMVYSQSSSNFLCICRKYQDGGG